MGWCGSALRAGGVRRASVLEFGSVRACLASAGHLYIVFVWVLGQGCGVALVGRLFDAGSFHHWLHSECFGLGFEAFRLGLGLEVLGLEFKVMALGFNVLGQWFGVQGPGFMVLGLGFTVLGTGFEGLGLGFDVGGCLRLLGLGFPNSRRSLEPQPQIGPGFNVSSQNARTLVPTHSRRAPKYCEAALKTRTKCMFL